MKRIINTRKKVVDLKTLLLISALVITGLFQESLAQSENPYGAIPEVNPDANFHEIQATFETYFQNYPSNEGDHNGSIYKPYKRWEWYWSQRLGPSGDFNVARNAMQNYYDEQGENEMKSTTDCISSANWSELGPNLWPSGSGNQKGIGRIDALAFHPTNPNIMYAGSPWGGLWKSTNAGQLWQKTGTDELAIIGVSDIAIHPLNPNIIYIATGNADTHDWGNAGESTIGVYKSLDGGATFQPTDLSIDSPFTGTHSTDFQFNDRRRIDRLIIHPTSPDILLAAFHDVSDPNKGGVFRTTDGGDSWNQVLPLNGMTGSFRDLDFKPGSPNVIYAGGGEGSLILRSNDAGVTWTDLYSINGNDVVLPSPLLVDTPRVVRTILGVSAADPDVLYLLCAENTQLYAGLYKSTDGGDNFVQLPATNIGANATMKIRACLTVSDTDADEVYVGNFTIAKSTDGGNSFTYNQGSAHVDIHALEVIPNTDLVVAGTDGGVFIQGMGAAPNPSTWQQRSNGLSCANLYSVGVAQSDFFTVTTGAQDVNSLKYDGLINPWFRMGISGDGMFTRVDPRNASIIFAESQNGAVRRSTNGGVSFGAADPPGVGAWVTPYELGPINPDEIYVGQRELWYSPSQGVPTSSYQQISDFQTHFSSNTFINSVAPAPSNHDYIYVGKGGTWNGSSFEHMIFRTSTGGGTSASDWVDVTPPLTTQWQELTEVAVDPHDELHIWATFSGYNANRVFESFDGGDNWMNISFNLPSMPVNSIVADSTSVAQGIYVGTDVGVFYKDQTANVWHCFSDGMPNVVITELRIQYDCQMLRASTYGRGIWESSLYCGNGDVDLFISGTHTSDYFTASNNITSAATIAPKVNPTDKVVFRAGNSITLQNTFQVQNGGEFHAFLAPCYPCGANAMSPLEWVEIDEDKLFLYDESSNSLEDSPIMTLSVSPNPFSQVVAVEMNEILDHQDIQIRVYDLSGTLVRSKQVLPSVSRMEIDLGNLAAGTYILRVVRGENEIKSTKIVKH